MKIQYAQVERAEELLNQLRDQLRQEDKPELREPFRQIYVQLKPIHDVVTALLGEVELRD